jgi:thiol-disulfide isomerase/thioredoxin
MKKIILSIILMFTVIITNAQIATVGKLAVSAKSVVRDSMGMVYTPAKWISMLRSGDYSLLPFNPDNKDTEYLLVKLNEEQINERMSRMPRPEDSPFFKTGKAIKPIDMHDVYHYRIDASQWAGKTVVLNFWFIACAPCRAEMPQLNKLVQKYKNDPNVIFIGIALDPSDDDIQDFVKTNPFSYRLVSDGREFAQLFKINTFPTNVVIDKTGKVRLHYVGMAINGPYWIDKTIQESEKATL